MLDQHLISVWKLKQAYELNGQEAEDLLCALAPHGVFPYALWQRAYAAHWRNPAQDAARVWKFEAPRFPEAGELPEKHCPTDIYAKWMIEFFLELAKVLYIKELEQGFNYILEAVYDGTCPFQAEKENLFRLLTIEEKHISNHTRLSGKRKVSVPASQSEFLLSLFVDTVAVDKTAAARHLHSCGFPLRHEVKGLARALAEQSISAPAPAEMAETDAVSIPAVLWEGKTYPAVRDALRENNYSDPVIARVLYEWCGLTNQTQIGMLLGPAGALPDSTSLRRGKRLLAEAETLSIRKA